MTGASYKVDFDDHDVVRKLSDLEILVSNPGPILEDAGLGLVLSTQDRFETGVGPDGEKWKVSGASKERGGKTLIDGGDLYGSITFDVSNDSVEVGTNRIYAAIHQFGGVIVPKNAKNLTFKVGDKFVSTKKVTIPARPYLGISDEDWDMIGETIEDHLKAAWQ